MTTSLIGESFVVAIHLSTSSEEANVSSANASTATRQSPTLNSLSGELKGLVAAVGGPVVRNKLRLTAKAWGDVANGETRSLKIHDVRGLSTIESNQFPLLQDIDLSRINLGGNHTDAPAVARALRENDSQTAVNLSHNLLGNSPGDLPAIADALCENWTLTSANLSYNSLGIYPGDALAIADILLENCTLTTINWSNNLLGRNPIDAPVIADALRQNRTLTTLNWSNNLLGRNATDAPAIAHALRDNHTLSWIDLRDNQFSEDEKCMLAELAQETSKTILT